jgi:hypothetical protein
MNKKKEKRKGWNLLNTLAIAKMKMKTLPF